MESGMRVNNLQSACLHPCRLVILKLTLPRNQTELNFFTLSVLFIDAIRCLDHLLVHQMLQVGYFGRHTHFAFFLRCTQLDKIRIEIDTFSRALITLIPSLLDRLHVKPFAFHNRLVYGFDNLSLLGVTVHQFVCVLGKVDYWLRIAIVGEINQG